MDRTSEKYKEAYKVFSRIESLSIDQRRLLGEKIANVWSTTDIAVLLSQFEMERSRLRDGQFRGSCLT